MAVNPFLVGTKEDLQCHTLWGSSTNHDNIRGENPSGGRINTSRSQLWRGEKSLIGGGACMMGGVQIGGLLNPSPPTNDHITPRPVISEGIQLRRDVEEKPEGRLLRGENLKKKTRPWSWSSSESKCPEDQCQPKLVDQKTTNHRNRKPS